MFGLLASIVSSVISAGSAVASALAPAATVAGAAGGIYSAVTASRQGVKAESLRKEELAAQERMAGEYYELTEAQMALQSQTSQMRTLADLIARQRQSAPPQVFTLPPAKSYSVLDQFNQAIDRALRG